tara:strand:- start:710 stop:814 length:105 start_codon:yes stop_codon:yes gene_type:complete
MIKKKKTYKIYAQGMTFKTESKKKFLKVRSDLTY